MKDLIERNYQVTRNRGKITEYTTGSDFRDKLREEVDEFADAMENNRGDYDYELADVILVCLNIAKHYGIDIEQQMKHNVELNSKRND